MNTTKNNQPLVLGSTEGLGPLPEAPHTIAYLYHDAASAETANPLLHSTLVVMAAERRPALRNETPLVTLAQAEAMVAAERERCAQVCEQQICACCWDDDAQAAAEHLAAEIRKAPNARLTGQKRPPQEYANGKD